MQDIRGKRALPDCDLESELRRFGTVQRKRFTPTVCSALTDPVVCKSCKVQRRTSRAFRHRLQNGLREAEPA